MNYYHWTKDVSNFSGNIASYTDITNYAGNVLRGPEGWVKASKVLSNASLVATFIEWTSQAYYNEGRLSASIRSAEMLAKASNMVIYYYNYFPVYNDFDIIKGFAYYS
jgi:hypothetical protein